MDYQEVEGNLIKMALEGKFDVIAHGCNCFCTMGAGIAPQMAEAFGCDEFDMERTTDSQAFGDPEDSQYEDVPNNNRGNINKLGQIDYQIKYLWFKHPMKENLPSLAMNHMSVGQKDVGELYVVNCYTQYGFGSNHKEGTSHPLSYPALILCLQKINHTFPGKHIGLPLIGCGLAGGNWEDVKGLIQKNLNNMKVTIVHYKPEEDGSTSSEQVR